MGIETAAIVGTGWGRVRFGTLRAEGVEVVALVGKSLDEGFSDVALHPWAWIEHRVGPLRRVAHRTLGGGVRFELEGRDGVPVALRFRSEGPPGIENRIRCLGYPWRFEASVGGARRSTGMVPWISVNQACVA